MAVSIISYIVFPQTVWINYQFGFSDIKKLVEEIRKQKKIKAIRELAALILEIEDIDTKILHRISYNLPNGCELSESQFSPHTLALFGIKVLCTHKWWRIKTSSFLSQGTMTFDTINFKRIAGFFES